MGGHVTIHGVSSSETLRSGSRKWNPIEETDGAAHVYNPSAIEVPRFQITPTVSGTATAEILLDAGAGQIVIGARATVNAMDIVTASDAIKNRYPDVKRIIREVPCYIIADEAITSVYVCGIGDATANNVIANTETTDASIRATLVHFEFSATDVVKMVKVSLSEFLTSDQQAILRIEGASYAV